MNRSSLVSIVILHYRHPEVTAECLSHVLAQDHEALEVIVVNNGSPEDLATCAGLSHPRVAFIQAPRNLGYAAGNNLGIRAATGSWVALVNNDVFLPPDWIRRMISAWEFSEEWGLLSSVIVKTGTDQELQYAGFSPVSPYTGRNQLLGAGEKWNPQDRITGTSYAHGAAMMISRAALDRVGGVSEQYFLYYEELDWSMRVRKAGFLVGVYEGVCAYHHGSLSIGKDSAQRWYYYHRSRWIFQRIWLRPGQKAIFFLYYLFIASPKELILHIASGKWQHICAWAEAIWWHLRHWRSLPPVVGERSASAE